MRWELVSITEASASEDGARIRITMALADGKEAVLDMPADEAVSLIDLAAAASAQCELITDTDELPAAQVSWFELGEVEDTDDFYLSLTFGSGGRLNFILERSMAEQLAAAIHTRLHPPAPAPEAS